MIKFNPSKIEKSVTTIRIETGLLNEIDSLASKADISRNEFILQCINFAMEHYSKTKKEK